MKRTNLVDSWLPRLLVLTVAFAGCDDPSGPRREPPVGLQITPDTITLTIGTTTTKPRAVVFDRFTRPDSSAVIIWEIPANSAVIREADSVFRAVAVGEAEIVARSGTFTDTLRVTVPPPARFTQITSGNSHSCGLDADGNVFCWGRGLTGQNCASFCATWPTSVPGGLRLDLIDAGYSYVCGLADGVAYCWGNGGLALGNGGSQIDRPLAVVTDLRFNSIAGGLSHTCALTSDGAAYCWGRNEVGMLGTGNLFDAPTPVRAAPALSFRMLDVGERHTCGIATTGDTYCWGSNRSGELGNGEILTTEPRGEPTAVRVLAPAPFVRVFTGLGRNSCALTESGQAYCWGSNEKGELGAGAGAAASTPRLVSSTLVFRELALIPGAVCGLDFAGTVYCWGEILFQNLHQPTAIASDAAFVQLVAGGAGFCGRSATNEIYCWGANYSGQLGNGHIGGSLRPVAVLPARG